MKKLMFIFLIVFCFCHICLAGEDEFYQKIFDIAYHPGYDTGDMDKRAKRQYNSEGGFENPYLQDFIKTLKVKHNCHKPRINMKKKQKFDWAFKNGWSAGYDDGYYGKTKRKTQYKAQLFLKISED